MPQENNNRIVKTGMIIGVVVTLGLFLLLYALLPKFENEVELLARIKLAFECLVFPATFFLVVVVRLGSQRFGNPSDNPLKVVANSESMKINLRVLSNTHEQLVIFTSNIFALSIFLPALYLSLLPIYSAVFVLGRIMFWVAYKHNALWRAPGFAMGILPAVIGLGYCCIVLLVRAFSFL